jgi:hypothetical protein
MKALSVEAVSQPIPLLLPMVMSLDLPGWRITFD